MARIVCRLSLLPLKSVKMQWLGSCNFGHGGGEKENSLPGMVYSYFNFRWKSLEESKTGDNHPLLHNLVAGHSRNPKA